MATELADHCPSGGSASQSPDSAILQQYKYNNNNNNHHLPDNNKILPPPTWKGKKSDAAVSSDYLDDVFYDKMHLDIKRKDRKIKQKTRRQIFQQQYNALVQIVPDLKNRTSRTPLTKNAILKSTMEYINQLKDDPLSNSHQLKEELRIEHERNVRLQKELHMWREKVQRLREQKLK